jgi:hypothetical protein
VKLLDLPTHDGGRQFAALPQMTDPVTLRDHFAKLPGVKVGLFLDSVSESWIEFELEGHEFSVNDQFGEFWFFVKNPDAPDQLLERVTSHAIALLGDPAEGHAELERRSLAFGYGLTGAVLGVLILRKADLSWSVLAPIGLVLFAGILWVARSILLKRPSTHDPRRLATDARSESS